MRRIPVLLFIAIFALSGVIAVFAHAEPAQVKPGLGANVTTVPTQVEIVMTQEMARRADANDIDVFGP
jgi:hypothetical protein